MLNSRAIDIAVFQQLSFKTGNVVDIQALPSFDGLLSVQIRLEAEDSVKALTTSEALPAESATRLVGARVIVVEALHPLTLGSEVYTRTILTTGTPERWVLLADHVPAGASLY